jgi:hypothetical protein
MVCRASPRLVELFKSCRNNERREGMRRTDGQPVAFVDDRVLPIKLFLHPISIDGSQACLLRAS